MRVLAPAGGEPRPARVKVDPADRSPLSNALRDWRTARARADAVAPFIVFHDSTIEAIAASRPRSIAELRRVPGVGPMKLDRYGEEIIASSSARAELDGELPSRPQGRSGEGAGRATGASAPQGA